MIRYFTMALATLAACALWAVLVFIAFSEGWGKRPIAHSDTTQAFVESARLAVEASQVGNFGMALIEDNQIADVHFFSSREPVSESTVFQVASLGKWVTAWGVMVLVEDGKIDLDRPVGDYLTRWHLPPSDFDNAAVTVRRLLSHTAGLDDGLGYDGFDNAREVQTLEESLSKALDASPGNSGVVQLGAEPGSGWNYSGGGYTLLQLLVEEVAQQSFTEFMASRVFQPLGMSNTTFDQQQARQLDLAQNFDQKGDTEPFRWYTALAATSLFTTVEDLGRFITVQTQINGQSVLSEDTLALMRTPHASQMGADIWGLGPMLYAPNNAGGHVIGHDGSNGPGINTAARFDPQTGSGIVILSTGSEVLATKLAGEWTFWKTGNVGSLLFLMSIGSMLLVIGVGAGTIVLLGIVAGWTWRKRSAT